MTTEFAGKTVLVTGGAAGLGRAYALAFGRKGAHLILADINEPGMVETRALVEGVGGTAEWHRCDMSSEADIQALGAAVCDAHESLEGLNLDRKSRVSL